MNDKINYINFKSLYEEYENHVAHRIHTYAARLIPQIPRFIISKYTKKNDVVLDPFCGSGTVLLESRLLSRNSIGIDINSLAVLISQVKTNIYDQKLLLKSSKLINKILEENNGSCDVEFLNKDYWFSGQAISELSRIKHAVDIVGSEFGEKIYKFFLLCFSSIIRKSSYADPIMAKTYKSKKVVEKIKEGWNPTPIRYYKEAQKKLICKINTLENSLQNNKNFIEVIEGDSRKAHDYLNNYQNKIDLVITSPPYVNAQDYFRNYKLELYWLSLLNQKDIIELNKKVVGSERVGKVVESGYGCESDVISKFAERIEKHSQIKANIVRNYFTSIHEILAQMRELIKQDKYLCLITGNNKICGVEVINSEVIQIIAEGLGFRLIEVYKNKISKRVLFTKRNHNNGVIKEERISIFKKISTS